MNLRIELDGKWFEVDPTGTDISIPLRFNGPQPNTYGVPKAVSAPFEGGGFVGDTRRGGSCNFETYTFTPHCNGTHTEGVGHIALSRISVHEVMRQALQPAYVVTVTPSLGSEAADRYDPALAADDLVIERAALAAGLAACPPEVRGAVVVRTLPNHRSKLGRDYMAEPPAFFSLDAMQLLHEMGFHHLLTDLPSVDRLFDEGKLNAHHIWWQVPAGSHDVTPNPIAWRTITEMVYVPDQLEDGVYLLNLQTAAFVSDATPSRPFLHRLTPVRPA